MSEYEPGTVAVATVRGVPNVRVFRAFGGWTSEDSTPNGFDFHSDEYVTDVRPLVVLDFEGMPFGYKAKEGHRYFPDWLRTAALAADQADKRNGRRPAGHGDLVRYLADQIEAQTRLPKPKPPEPQGLGAVVEDAEGRRYVRHCPSDCEDGRLCIPWHRVTDAFNRTYDEFDAVRVLSEGVTS